MDMSALGSSVSLLVAQASLAEVQAVVSAMNASGGGAANGAGYIERPAAEFAPRAVVREVCYAPRQVIHPTPRYLPRPVLHPTPRIEAQNGAAPYHKSQPPHITPPPPPPWKIPPQSFPTAPNVGNIKPAAAQPDYINRGRMIDLFI
jgi:hypothetical protein